MPSSEAELVVALELEPPKPLVSSAHAAKPESCCPAEEERLLRCRTQTRLPHGGGRPFDPPISRGRHTGCALRGSRWCGFALALAAAPPLTPRTIAAPTAMLRSRIHAISERERERKREREREREEGRKTGTQCKERWRGEVYFRKGKQHGVDERSKGTHQSHHHHYCMDRASTARL